MSNLWAYIRSWLPAVAPEPTYDDLVRGPAVQYAQDTRFQTRSTPFSKYQEVEPITNELGVSGSARHLLKYEVQRVRNAKHQKRRGRTAVLAGVTTLIFLLEASWMFVCGLATLVWLGSHPDSIRYLAAVVGVIANSLTIFALIPILFYCRLRRPTLNPLIAYISVSLVVLFQTILSTLNLGCILSWRGASGPRDPATRCSWSWDVTWSIGQGGQECNVEAGDAQAWILTASFRLVFTSFYLAWWIYSIRLFSRSLVVAELDQQDFVPTAEAQTLLASKSATIIKLKDAHSAPVEYDEHGRKQYLPAMPQEKRLLTAEEIEASEKGSLLWRLASSVGSTVAWLAGYSQPVEEMKQVDEKQRYSTDSAYGNVPLLPQTKYDKSLRRTKTLPATPDDAWEYNGSDEDELYDLSMPRARPQVKIKKYIRMNDGRLIRKLSTIREASSDNGGSQSSWSSRFKSVTGRGRG